MNRALLSFLILGLGSIAAATPTQVSTGLNTTCMIDGGALYCWGDNTFGQVGIGSVVTPQPTPQAVTGMSSGVTAVAVSGNDEVVCAIQNGAMYCWGHNNVGQLGDNTFSDEYVPTGVSSAGGIDLSTGVTQVAPGGDHTCALQGTVAYCWGDNTYGQLGNNNKLVSPIVPTTNVPFNYNPVTAIAANRDYTCGIGQFAGSSGFNNVECWGRNDVGQSGNGSLTEYDYPAGGFVIAGNSTSVPTALSAGLDHACALVTGGIPYCWGNDADGEIGNGTVTTTPVTAKTAPSGSLSGLTEIAAGGKHSCALSSTSGWCWGSSSTYQLDTSTIVTWPTPLVLPPMHVSATSISTGDQTTCFIHSSAVVCVGADGMGGTAPGPTLACGDGYIDVVGEACDDGNTTSGDGCDSSCQVQAGYSCAGTPSLCTANCGNGVLDAGETCDDGNSSSGDGCSSACQIESGYSCTGTPSVCGLTCGNGVLDAGETCDDGNTTSADGCSSTCQVESGYSCNGTPSVCGLTCGNGVINTGEACDDGNYTSGDGCSSTCQIETGYFCSGAPSSCALSVAPTTTPLTISAGLYNTCKITAAGALFCWGDNSYGQLTDGTFTNSATPLAISGMSAGVTDVSVSGDGYTICAVKSGSLYCWGDNATGQIGDGSSSDRYTPTLVSSLASVQRVASAGNHTCALVLSRTIVSELDEYCWGDNTYGQLGLGNNTNPHASPTLVRSGGVRDIAANRNHTCDVLGGSIYCWGRNDWGQLGVGSLTDSNARGNAAMTGVQVSSGWNHVCGITSAGAAKCWGANDDGQIGNLDCGSYAPCVGGTSRFTTAQTVFGSVVFSSIVAGGSDSCGVASSGSLKTVQCWGYGGHGQMGAGQGSPNCESTMGGIHGHGGTLNEVCNNTRPTVIVGQKSSGAAIGVGGFHIADTLFSSPAVMHAWGDDNVGQLGDGSSIRVYLPTTTIPPTGGW